MLAFSAALSAGYDKADYDFNVVVMPLCESQGFAGIAWVGVPGVLINAYATDYDSAVSHELVR